MGRFFLGPPPRSVRGDAAAVSDTPSASLSYAPGAGLTLSGTATAGDLTLLRRGQQEPFIRHRTLEVAVTDLTLAGGELAVERVAISGAPVILDASVSPPQQFDVMAASVVATDVTWPGARPARVTGEAMMRHGGRARIDGTVDVATLAVDVRATFSDVGLPRVAAYLPPAAPAVAAGQGSGAVRLRHDRAHGARIDGELVLTGLVAARDGTVFLSEDRARVTFAGLTLNRGAFALERASLDASPALVDRHGGARVELGDLDVTVEALGRPSPGPARVTLDAKLPDRGALTGNGRIDLDGRTFRFALRADDAALAPYGALLGLAAPLAGSLDATLALSGTLGASGVRVTGDASVENLAIGPAERPPLTIERIEATGVEVAWPARVDVARLVLARPSALLEREQDGTFPLRQMLFGPGESRSVEPTGEERPSTSAAVRVPASAVAREAGARADARRPTVEIDEIQLADGDVRFIDRTTRPFYSEEITRLVITVGGFSTRADDRAEVTIKGIVGADAALDLRGQLAAFAEPFYLDVSGELKQFAVPRTNPYLRRFLDWIARRGSMTTKVHYRIVGDRIEGTNEFLVQRLDLERARGDGDAERRVGIPLDLAVSLLKRPGGDIRLQVPVSGDLRSPRFSFGDAIATAIKNTVARLVTAPFRAIGRVFTRGETVESVEVEPVEFPAGVARLTPAADRHLQRVADFLRASPYIALRLEPVITEVDLEALRREEVAARIQQLQRDAGLEFDQAARRLFAAWHPGDAVPEDAAKVVQVLAQRLPLPTDAARRLAERRLELTRTALVEEAGVQPDRLLPGEGALRLSVSGTGRVEFALRPEADG